MRKLDGTFKLRSTNRPATNPAQQPVRSSDSSGQDNHRNQEKVRELDRLLDSKNGDIQGLNRQLESLNHEINRLKQVVDLEQSIKEGLQTENLELKQANARLQDKLNQLEEEVSPFCPPKDWQ